MSDTGSHSVSLGYDKYNKRVRKRLGADFNYANQFKVIWNSYIERNDTFGAQMLTEATGLVSLDGAIDTSDSSPCKDLLWQLLASIAEFERKLIFSRCEEGRVRAKAAGKHLGRHSKTTKQQDEQMKLAHDQGQSYAQIGKTFGISRMSVYRRLKRTHRGQESS